METATNALRKLSVNRPVGTTANQKIIEYLTDWFKSEKYEMNYLPFDCTLWKRGNSTVQINGQNISIQPSPFSYAFTGEAPFMLIDTKEQLYREAIQDKILILHGKIAKNPLMPKNFPYYYPEEDKSMIDFLEQNNPKAIIAVTEKNALQDLSPFPLFADGNFAIPSAYGNSELLEKVSSIDPNTLIQLDLISEKIPSTSTQLVATKRASSHDNRGKILICAHMDSQYNTSGALDNAVGVVVMMKLMEQVSSLSLSYDVEFVPFNSEEHYSVNGELAYLDYLKNQTSELKLVINIDSPCHQGSKTAISHYQLDDALTALVKQKIAEDQLLVEGDPWLAGDHCAFIMKQIPCLAVTSSDFFEGALAYIHTPLDTIDTIGIELIEATAQSLFEIIKALP